MFRICQSTHSNVKTIAESIKQTFRRADDKGFRIGGEEFVVMFDSKTKEGAKIVVENFMEFIKKQQVSHSHSNTGYLTVSAGLLIIEPGDMSVSYSKVFKEADQLLYHMKESGRNGYKFIHCVEENGRLVSLEN